MYVKAKALGLTNKLLGDGFPSNEPVTTELP